MDYKAIAERYTVDEAVVKKKIEEYSAKIKVELATFYDAEHIDAEVEKIVTANVSSLFRPSGFEYAKSEFEKGKNKGLYAIVLGVSKYEDKNDYKKNDIRKWYYRYLNGGTWKEKDVETGEYVEKNHAPNLEMINQWITSGKIKIGKSKDGKDYPIPLESERETTYKDESGATVTKENKKFGEEIETVLRVKVPMIITAVEQCAVGKDGKIVKTVDENKEDFVIANLPWDRDNKDFRHVPKVGRKSILYANKYGTTWSIFDLGHEDKGVYDKAYETAMRVLQTTEHWMDLNALMDADPRTVFATSGSIQQKKIEGDGLSARIRINSDDLIGGIGMKSNYLPVVEDVEELNIGDEVVVVGRKMQFKNDKDEMIQYYELWGVIRNRDAGKDAVLQRLRDKGLL
jgi:hypothetical protein